MIRLKLWLGAALGAIAALVMAYLTGRRDAVRKTRARQAKQTLENVEAGNEAVRQMSGANRAAWIERLRNN